MNSASASVEAISRWFDLVEVADLRLPDRWFAGRPYDDQLRLTHIAARGDGLVLELEDDVRLVFTGVPTVQEETLDHADHLVLDDFEELLLEWRDIDGTACRSSRYTDGPVTLGFLRGSKRR